jgi:hypothetical protein
MSAGWGGVYVEDAGEDFVVELVSDDVGGVDDDDAVDVDVDAAGVDGVDVDGVDVDADVDDDDADDVVEDEEDNEEAEEDKRTLHIINLLKMEGHIVDEETTAEASSAPQAAAKEVAPEPPKAAAAPEPPKAAAAPEPPKAAAAPEPPKAQKAHEPPKAQKAPEPRKAAAAPEPPHPKPSSRKTAVQQPAKRRVVDFAVPEPIDRQEALARLCSALATRACFDAEDIGRVVADMQRLTQARFNARTQHLEGMSLSARREEIARELQNTVTQREKVLQSAVENGLLDSKSALFEYFVMKQANMLRQQDQLARMMMMR